MKQNINQLESLSGITPTDLTYTESLPSGKCPVISGFTIDTNKAKIRDDGFSIKYEGQNMYIGICIANIISHSPFKNQLDKEIWKNLPEPIHVKYLPDRPPSFNPHKQVQAIMCRVCVDRETLEIGHCDFKEVFFVSKKAYSFSQVDYILENIPVHARYSRYEEDMYVLRRIAQKCRRMRMQPNNSQFEKHINAGDIVEELMILANYLLSVFLFKHNVPFIMRYDFDNMCDNTSVGVYTHIYTQGHSNLGLPIYGHFTSPSWRFVDFIHQHILLEYIRNRRKIFDYQKISTICQYINGARYRNIGSKKVFLLQKQKYRDRKFINLIGDRTHFNVYELSHHIQTIVKNRWSVWAYNKLFDIVQTHTLRTMDYFNILFIDPKYNTHPELLKPIQIYLMELLFYTGGFSKSIVTVLCQKNDVFLSVITSELNLRKWTFSISVLYDQRQIEVSYTGIGNKNDIEYMCYTLLLFDILALPMQKPSTRNVISLEDISDIIDNNYEKGLLDIAYYAYTKVPSYHYKTSKKKGYKTCICSFIVNGKRITRQVTAKKDTKNLASKKMYDYIVKVLTPLQ